jgi:nitrogen regulatory protein PII
MKLVVAVIKPFRLGRIGGGNIFVLDLQSALRIRTGEIDAAAI